MRIFVATSLILVLAPSVSADFLLYEFTGIVPDGASQHSQILDGESWTAQFIVETMVGDSNPDTLVGVYENNVQQGLITFSGGFSQNLDVNGWQTRVYDDVTFDGSFADAVSIRDQEVSEQFLAQAYVLEDALPDTLTGDSLPEAGLTFASSGKANPPAFLFQFFFEDQFTGETINYTSVQGINVTFSATAIPEPCTSFLVLTCIGFLCASRKRTGR